MPIDRDEALRRAEKLLRQGRLDAAIDEYSQLAAAFQTDLSIANTLGDLLLRSGALERATAEFVRIADHFHREGFYPKAAAIYRKVLKTAPDHAHALRQLAEISMAQGMVRDAKSALQALMTIQQRRDDPALGETLRRLADLEPDDVGLQRRAAEAQAGAGDAEGAVARLKDLAARLSEAGRHQDSLAVWESVHALEPSSTETRLLLARSALAQNRLDDAAGFLGDPGPDEGDAWWPLRAEIALRRGDADAARAALSAWSERGASDAEVVELSLTHGQSVDEAYLGTSLIASRLAGAGEHADAVGALQLFLGRYPRYAPALAELLERAVDADLTAVAIASQRGLVDAHLDAGRLAEARLIAEDLVSRAPDDLEHQAYLLRALEAAGDPDPRATLDAHLASFFGEPVWETSEELPQSVGDTSGPPTTEVDDTSAAPIPESDEPASSSDIEVPAIGGTATREAAPSSVPVQEVDLTAALEALAVSTPSRGGASSVGPDVSRGADGTPEAGDDDRQRLSAAVSLIGAGLHEEASRLLHELTTRPATRGTAMVALGDLSRTKGEGDLAERYYRTVLAEPHATAILRRARYGLGCALADAGRTSEALVVLLELLADAGEYLDARARVDALSSESSGG